MKLAHIVPPDWVGTFPLGEYRMALAHWVLKYPAYAEQLRKGPKGRSAYILMDSGSFEGEQVSVDQINEGADALKADEIVLPDVLGSAGESLKRSWDALGKVATKRVMFVPQGTTTEEWYKCLHKWLSAWTKHAWDQAYQLSIGVTSLGGVEGVRIALLDAALKTNYPVHLLGLHRLDEDTRVLLERAVKAGVRGMDTSTAFALGARGVLVAPHAKKVRLGDPTQYTKLSTRARRLITLNMVILDNWVLQGEVSEKIPTHLIRQTASRWIKYWAEGFADIDVVMKACSMPTGRYALLRTNRRETYVRPLNKFQKLLKQEILVEVKK